MRPSKLAVLALATASVIGLPAAQASAQPLPFPFDTGSLGSGSDGPGIPTEDTLPALTVTPVLDGLDHPWDAVQAPDGAVLTGQRSAGSSSGVRTEAPARSPPISRTCTRSPRPVVGIALASNFANTRTLYTCQGFQGGGVTDIRILSWTVDAGWTTLTRGAAILTGIPVDEGRHGGSGY